MLWALTDLEVQFLAFVDSDQTIDATLIVSYILAPSIGTFLTIGILLFLHLSNITSLNGLFRLRSYKNQTISTETHQSKQDRATLLIGSNDELVEVNSDEV